MKKLESFGVKELCPEDIRKTYGGFLSTLQPFLGVAHAITDFVDGAIERFNTYRTK
ncbi:hypothetical protein [Tenacibaculum sp.]|uniref:hypothetical protein n=1 Tax=Tenacibaculum sp. TaxID=1906242 RepID=UPI003D0B2A04